MDGPYKLGSTNQHGVFRQRQWLYIGPIIAAPLTHMCVTLYRKTPRRWRPWMAWGGVGGLSLLAVANRLVLMYHAGYPCEDHIDVKKRLLDGKTADDSCLHTIIDVVKHSI
eukprot:gene9441-1684_t